MPQIANYISRMESLKVRIQALMALRNLIGLPPERDMSKEQWAALNTQLGGVANRLQLDLRHINDLFLANRQDAVIQKKVVEDLGILEMKLSQAYNFFDTFMDVLTQRLSKPIGEMMIGCDKIAKDGTRQAYLDQFFLQPLVYCDRGFGASTLRQEVNIIKNVPNPIQLIGVPYSRLIEKYNLISIYHEVGHQTLIKLGLIQPIRHLFSAELKKAGATPLIASLYANWVRELAPDFWAFCLTGIGQTCSLKDVLAVTHDLATQISATQPHPPAYLRFLASVAWCRRLWGKGIWDDWEKDWLEKYPINNVPSPNKELLMTAQQYLPLAAKIFTDARFTKLDNKPLTSLFKLQTLQPYRLWGMANKATVTSTAFSQEPIGVQLAVFRLLREKRTVSLTEIDALMTVWLKNI
jgi:hypothetical protein